MSSTEEDGSSSSSSSPFKRFSETVLWDMQRGFYEEEGVKCWQETVVPNFVSSNCFIAQAYASAILSFLRDYWMGRAQDGGPPPEPVYIVEVGAGSAKLSYVLVHKLLKMRRHWPCEGCFKYLVTDISSSNFDFWLNHPSLQRLTQAGLVDFGLWDGELGGPLRMELSGKELKPGEQAHPVICVANYVFDSLKQDAFRVMDGTLFEVLCSVDDHTLAARGNPKALPYVKCDWRASPASHDNYYKDRPVWNSLLEDAVAEHSTGSASFLLPVGSLRLIENLRSLAGGGRLAVLAGDKGHTTPLEIAGTRNPHIAMHGSFSCMVNFMALRKFCGDTGGWVHSAPHTEGFKCCAMVLGMGSEQECGLDRFRMSIRRLLGSFGPDGFSALQRCMKEELKGVRLRTALSILRLSQFDPDVFYKFKQTLIDDTRQASSKLQADIRRDMEEVYACHFPLQPSKDIAFEIGRVFMELKDFVRAAQLFRDSQRSCGVHHVSWFNMGVCHRYLNQFKLADECFAESLLLCPDYVEPVKWREELRQVQRDQSPPGVDGEG
jgi:hypothetical protein